MDVLENRAIVKEVVINPMLEAINEFGIDNYDEDDVAAVKSILYAYVDALAELSEPTDEAIMAEVQFVVEALNELNESRDCGMIETEEREWLWEAIQTIAVNCGLRDVPDDVTEEWREW